MMSELSFDVTIDVLCKLCVNDLLRFRCVSKPWRSFIDSPYFVKLHLCTNSTLGLFLQIPMNSSAKEYYMDLNSVSKTAEELDFLYTGRWPPRIIGSCNGLVAYFYLCSDSDSYKIQYVLCNPLTREQQLLPIWRRYSVIETWYSCYGFGYDAINDDYKIVIIGSSFMVYSLKSNSWRPTSSQVHLFPLEFVSPFGTLFNGAFHWILQHKGGGELAMLAFDIVNEGFGEVPLPEALENYNVNTCCLRLVSVEEGCLRCMKTESYHYDIKNIEVWEMKEYGVKNSWVKVYSWSPGHKGWFPLSSCCDPLVAYGQNIDIVLGFKSRKNQTEMYKCPISFPNLPATPRSSPFSYVKYFTGTLVSIKSYKGIDDDNQRQSMGKEEIFF